MVSYPFFMYWLLVYQLDSINKELKRIFTLYGMTFICFIISVYHHRFLWFLFIFIIIITSYKDVQLLLSV